MPILLPAINRQTLKLRVIVRSNNKQVSNPADVLLLLSMNVNRIDQNRWIELKEGKTNCLHTYGRKEKSVKSLTGRK